MRVGASNVAFVIVVLVAVAMADVVLAETPQWIWASEQAREATSADQVAVFRREFEIEQPTLAWITLTCDNEYTLYVNGQRIASDGAWEQRERYEISAFLVAGRNLVAIRGRNIGTSPAGLAVTLTLGTAEGNSRKIVSDERWRVSTQVASGWYRVEFDDREWSAAVQLGEFGQTSPWGVLASRPPAERSISANSSAPTEVAHQPLELRDGDRVALIGGTFIERMQVHGYLETALTVAYPHRDITFRNLGWSGDTVWGDARAVFGQRQDGFRRLLKDLSETEATLTVVAYGANESFAGPAGLADFEVGLAELTDALESTATRIAFIIPHRFEFRGGALPTMEKQNRDLENYVNVLRAFAELRDIPVIDLFDDFIAEPLATDRAAAMLQKTENGIHLSAWGYWMLALSMTDKLEVPLCLPGRRPFHSVVDVDVANANYHAVGTTVHALKIDKDYVQVSLKDTKLVLGLNPAVSAPERGSGMLSKRLRIRGLVPGIYEVRIDGEVVARVDQLQLQQGIELAKGPNYEQAEFLRQAIQKKNEYYFHRYRPQNETYLFLFRKNEQGNNAVEIPQFDPLIQELEAQIKELREPRLHHYQIERTDGAENESK